MSPRGLQNLGNTCYLNTVLQCLFHCHDLTEKISMLSLPSPLSDEYQNLTLEGTSFLDGTAIRPTKFIQILAQICPKFGGYQQQDSHELLIFLLEKLESETKIIFDLFKGKLCSSIINEELSFESKTYEDFTCLSLEIPKDQTSIYDCLNSYTKTEILSGNNAFNHLGKLIQVEKRLTLDKLPNNLIIHLKRFEFTSSNRGKINTLVSFPIIDLDLSSYNHGKYDLYAIANHSGGLSGGHYYAYCLDSFENKWYTFNDSSVSSISSEDLVTSNAYLLFYTIRGI